MITLGIESTAHTFGIGIVKDRKIIANVMDTYKTEKGGLKPSELAEHHLNVFKDVFKKALKKARIRMRDVDLISYSQGPGIGHALRIGAVVARTLALKLRKPLVGVNHCIAHLEIGELVTKAKDPVMLYVSGANTQVIAFEGNKYRIFGETLDMGVGNFLDSFARLLDIGFPGGPRIEELAKKGKKIIKLPYSVKGMDVSFGGLFTNIKQKIESGRYNKEDLAYSLQETIFAMLVEVSERAMAHTGKNELLLGGGVSCNKRLQEMAMKMCKERGAMFYAPQRDLLVDNGAMIAWLGYLMYKSGNKLRIKEAGILPYQRTDEVDVNWVGKK